MQNLRLIKLSESLAFMETAALWFHDRWKVPKEAYLESMEQGASDSEKFPQWYIVLDSSSKIIAGAGIIENDFHRRKDLTPNVCALYVEPEYRSQGIARHLLDLCRKEAGHRGFPLLYLITDHTEFYEKCGWQFLMMVSCDSGEKERMYIAETK